MEQAGFWSGVVTLLVLQAFGYFLYTKIRAAKEKQAMLDRVIPPTAPSRPRDYPTDKP